MSSFLSLLALFACGEPEEFYGPDAPENHRFLACSPDGSRIAVLRHTGRNAELLVLESGADAPLFRVSTDSTNSDVLVRRYAAMLDRFGLDANTVPVPVNGQWPASPASAGIIQGFVDVYPAPVPFTIEPHRASGCDGMNWSVAAGLDRVRAPVLREDCVEDVALSAVYRGDDTLWFITSEDTRKGRFVGFAGVRF